MRRFIVAILLIAACGKKPDQELQEVASWSATLQLTAEKWLNNSVPSSFARATIDAGTKSFDQAEKDFAQKSPVRTQLDNLKAASGDFKQAIETNDRRAAAACARRFAESSRALKQLEESK